MRFLENQRITIYNLYTRFYYSIYMFISTFSLHISCMFTFLYLFYMSIYYACFIEETLSLAAAIRAGAEEVAGITRERYMQRLTWLKSATRLSIIFHKDDRKKPVFTRISNILENLRLDSADGRIRKQPYCILLTGAPGCGKTGTAMRLASELMRAKYRKFSATDVVTLNETDEFQSEYRTNHKVVIFDDMGAEDSIKSTVNPWRKVIDFVNNIRKTSLNPNLELKGNVYIQPDLVIITTNLTPKLNLYPWMLCAGAIYRRLAKVLHLEPYDLVYEVKRIDTNGCPKNKVGAYQGSKVFESKAEENEHVPLEQYLPSLIEDYLDFDEIQEDYVKKMNSLLDPPKSDLSAWQSFLNDQIYPRWPKKFELPPLVEAKLPWYQRFARKLCISHNVAICQSSILSTEKIEQQKSDCDLGTMEQLELIFNKENYLYFRDCLSEINEEVYIIETGFIILKRPVGYLIHPNKLSKFTNILYDSSVEMTIGPIFSISQLEECFQQSIVEKPQDITRTIQSPIYDGPIEFFRSHTYDLTLDEHHLGGPAFTKLLRNCQRKLPEMGAIGNMCDAPSSLLTYQFLRRAWHFDYPPIGVEYEFNGLTFDGLTKIGETKVIVEAKTSMCPRSDLKRYMKDFAFEEPCIGVGINYFGYCIYYAGDVPAKDLAETAMVCNAVFVFFQKYGKHFKVAIPFCKYKDHDDEFPPPKRITV